MNRPQLLAGLAASFAAAAAPARAADPADAARADLALANHILAREGVVDGFGHVSQRDPRDPAHYLLARSMAPTLVTADDILTYDLASVPLDARGRAGYAERFIHGAIYAARPDVMAVVHAHTPAVIPFGVSATPLRPVFHIGAFLGAGVPVFEIRDAGGPATDMLVSTQPLAEALARTLGNANVALMRGHGMVAVASTLHEAVFRAYYTAQDAQLQAEALRLGTPTYLNAEEARHATRTEAGLVERAWALWQRDVGAP